jgi:hypothetical protein
MADSDWVRRVSAITLKALSTPIGCFIASLPGVSLMSTAANYPMPAPAPANNDLDHLRLLSIFHYVYAVISALMACIPIIYVVIGIAIVTNAVPLDEVQKEFDKIEARQKANERQKQQPPGDDAAAGDANVPEGDANAPVDDVIAPAEDDFAPGDNRNHFKAEDAKILGVVFAVIGGILALMGWVFAFLVFLAGRKLAAHRSRTFCIVIAAFCCMMVPLGTLLGVFTLVVLSRQSVQALFDAPEQMRAW